MASMRRLGLCPMLAISLLSLTALGCGRSGNVSGQVRLEGKPLVFGTVQFEGSDGRLQQANIERDGSYYVTGVALGDAMVAVSSRNPKSSDFIPIEKEGMPKMPRLPDIPGWFPIPKTYEKFATSGLTFPIKAGENQIDIELKKP
jgi:hypothetical protein